MRREPALERDGGGDPVASFRLDVYRHRHARVVSSSFGGRHHEPPDPVGPGGGDRDGAMWIGDDRRRACWQGRVILFPNNPIDRWQTFGEHAMVLNALLFHNDFPA